MTHLVPTGRWGRLVAWLLIGTLCLATSVPVGRHPTAVGADPPAPAKGPRERMGEWSVPPLPNGGKDWMQAIHAVLLPNGKVLIANGSSNRDRKVAPGMPQIEGVDGKNPKAVDNTCLFDPANERSPFERLSSPKTPIPSDEDKDRPYVNDLFCCGHMHLWNGNVLIAGGTHEYRDGGEFYGSKVANVFDWRKKAWVESQLLREGHWYPTLVPLADGRVAVFSGWGLTESQSTPVVEFYDPAKHAWSWVDVSTDDFPDSPYNTPRTPQSPQKDRLALYPRIHALADGRFLVTGEGSSGIGSTTSTNTYFMTILSPRGDESTRILWCRARRARRPGKATPETTTAPRSSIPTPRPATCSSSGASGGTSGSPIAR